ncbi:MAG: endo-1,4-beta-xylanase [Treponemataceae bacterium]|nr:endo-1,4-beta-xylanase [Treponemataceae bacterium]
MYKQRIVCLLGGLLMVSCMTTEKEISVGASPQKGPPKPLPGVWRGLDAYELRDDLALKDVFAPYFLMGAAINGVSNETASITHEGMAALLKKHFNSTTLSNLMKPVYLLDEGATKKNPNGLPVCKFDTVEPALQFCKENAIKMRGHTLVWHVQTPKWFFHVNYDEAKPLADAATMERRLESYIQQVLTYTQKNYPGVIYCWDVVNEAVADGGGLRVDSPWYQTMGAGYIEKAFFYARKYADKNVALFYNDYNVFEPPKRSTILEVVESLKQKGVIDGIGLQPTVGLEYPELDSTSAPNSFRNTLQIFARTGLQLQVTELNFKIDGPITPQRLRQQAQRYYEMMYLLLKMDTDNGGPCNITSVTVFGLCDDYPLYKDFKQNLYLWDKDCRPKEAFYAYLQAGLDWKESQRK